MAAKLTPTQLQLTDTERAFVEEEREKMQRAMPGIRVSVSDALRHLMRRDLKHEARLHEVTEHIIAHDLAMRG